MSSLPERYVQLGLRLGKHLDGLVDGYFGPPELKSAVDAEEPTAPEALGDEAAALLADVEGWDDDPQRRRWLAGQLEGLACVAELVAGREVAWQDAVRRCYGIDVEPAPEDQFAAAHEQLDAALPGGGDLAERLQAWNRSQELPAEKVAPAFDALVERLRAETARLVELPDGERIDAETVTDQPWSAYNWYLGDRKADALVLPCSPGRARGLSRPSHRAFLQGGATCSEPRPDRAVDSPHPHAGVPHLRGHRAERDRAGARRGLDSTGRRDTTTARHLLRRGRRANGRPGVPRARRRPGQRRLLRARGGLERGQGRRVPAALGTLRGETRRKAVSFATHPVWGIYVPTYSHGYRLVKSSRLPFSTLLTEQVTTVDLLDARVA